MIFPCAYVDEFPGKSPLNFGSWILFSVPQLLLCLLMVWLWLQVWKQKRLMKLYINTYLSWISNFQLYFLGLPKFGKKSSAENRVEEERRQNLEKLIKGKFKALGKRQFTNHVVLKLGFSTPLPPPRRRFSNS